MDCMTLVRFLYEKIWQECLAHVQDCKVGFPFCRPGERSCVRDLMPSLSQPSLPAPYPSISIEAFLSSCEVRGSLAVGCSGSIYLTDPGQDKVACLFSTCPGQ